MIKSARVMKKAVAHLIPFMEEERALKAQELKAQGLEIVDGVRIISQCIVHHELLERRKIEFSYEVL